MTEHKSKAAPSASRVGTRGWVMGAMVAAAWAMSVGASDAQARDVYWSVGVNSPGVAVGVSNAPPPRVIVHQPRPVVVHPSYGYGYGNDYGYVRPVVVERVPVYVDQGPRYVYVDDWEPPRRRGYDRHGYDKHRGHKNRHHKHRGRGHDDDD